MLVVHSSNRLEVLLQQLLQAMQELPGDPFLPETIVVQNQGMARWVSQQIALKRGVCANIATPSPGQFMWQLPGYWIEQWSETPPVSKDSLVWQIYSLLPDLLPDTAFTELRRYLQRDKTGSGLFQLSQRIASVFDQYLIYRPELIARWENSPDLVSDTLSGAATTDGWQPVLWKAVMSAMHSSGNTGLHWASARQQFYPALESHAPVKPLPKRISVFGVASMPPLYIDMLTAASAHIDIGIYYVNPCREYWADIVDERGQSRRRARAREAGTDDPTGLLDIGNPLLASWGLAGQAFLDQLLEAGVAETDYFLAPQSPSLLANVQSDILELTNRAEADETTEQIAADDMSMQIHSAHSRLREIQILHDQLLSLFEKVPDLEPRDIIVMAPDIDQYAPFIDATFAAVDAPMRIPWSIADRRLRSEQRLLDTFCQLIDLPQSRFEVTEILSLLEVPAVSRRFALDNNGLQYLRQWIAESGIRWSLDEEMKADHGLPAEAANTWDFGLKRLFLGYALPATDEGVYQGIAPYGNIEGTSALYLGALQQFLTLCGEWRAELDRERPVEEWIELLERLAEAFFAPEDEEAYAIQALRSALHEIGAHAQSSQLQRGITRPVIAEILHQLLDDNSNSRQFITGQVTFSNMVPMRSIPFRVVCLIGMNAEGFPRDDRPDSFNLVVRQPKRGDRSRRTDDRYLFLETLLSARDTFYMSFIGNDIRDDTAKAPSIVITELMNYINDGYTRANSEYPTSAIGSSDRQIDAASDVATDVETSSAPVKPCLSVVRHPLQPFSKQYFNGSSPQLLNYKSHWFSAAGITVSDTVSRFYDQPLPDRRGPGTADDHDVVEIDLHQLISFYKDPARQFLIQGLQLQLLRDETRLEDDEPFALDGLQTWALKQQISGDLLSGAGETEILATVRAQGVLPLGAGGERLVLSAMSSVEQFLDRIKNRRTEPMPAQEVKLRCGRYLVSGQLEGLQSPVIQRDAPVTTDDGIAPAAADELPDTDLVLHRLGTMRASDLLEAWVTHTVKCLQIEPPCHTVLLCEDQTCIFRPPDNAFAILSRLLGLYQTGLVEPLHLFPETSLAYVENRNEQGEGDPRHPAVKKAWSGGSMFFGGPFQPGEANREPVRLVWRGQTPIEDPKFQAQAEAVFVPLCEYAIISAVEEAR